MYLAILVKKPYTLQGKQNYLTACQLIDNTEGFTFCCCFLFFPGKKKEKKKRKKQLSGCYIFAIVTSKTTKTFRHPFFQP